MLGTTETLMAFLARAIYKRWAQEGKSLPVKSERERACLEAPLNLVGILVWRILELAPRDWVLRVHDGVFNGLTEGRRYAFDPGAAELLAAKALAERVGRETGRAPALLALISHPPVLGDLAHLNIELVRHALWTLRELRGQPCRPRLVVAVDPFALDTISLFLEGMYAGVMGNYHIGLDRTALQRRAPSSWLLRRAAWFRMPWRLLGRLSAGEELGLAVAGGIETTGRLLYGLREALQEERASAPLRAQPAEVLRRLRADPGFARFEDGQPAAVKRSVWRLMELWAISSACGLGPRPEDPTAAETGRLEGETLRAVDASLQALGFSGGSLDKARERLAAAFARPTPDRPRLFSTLARRVLRRGRPIVFAPIVHTSEPPGVVIRPAWAWTAMRGDRIQAVSGAGELWQGTAEEFSEAFVRRNFS